MKSIVLAGVAWILAVAVLVSFYRKYKEPTKSHCLLLGLIWLVVISDSLDLFLLIQARVGSLRDGNTLFLLYTFFLGIRQLIVAIGCMYMLTYVAITQRLRNWVRPCFLAVNLYGAVLLLVNLKKNIIFTINGQGLSSTEDTFWLYYLVFVGFFAFTAFFLLRNRKRIDPMKKMSICFFMALPCISLPDVISIQTGLAGLLQTLALLWLYMSIPRTEKKTDAMTMALNEYAFEECLGNALKRGIPMQIMAIQFQSKEFLKEKYGETIYRALLIEISDQLSREVGRERVFYLNQGRFAILFPKGVNAVRERSEKILEQLQKTWNIQGKKIQEGISAALLTIPYDVNNAKDVYKQLRFLGNLTPQQLYDGKQLTLRHEKRENEVKQALLRALEGKGFTVSYQPIYGVAEGRLVAAEALLRMQDEVLGEVSPEEFIPIAEKENLMVKIGDIVLEQVCKFLHENAPEDYGIHYIEVNLSMAECMEQTLPERVEGWLETYQIDRSRLKLEITEKALVNHHAVLAKNMNKLNEKGIGFSLDDYGTGMAALAYIMTLPFQVVKVDKTILWTAYEDDDAMMVLCASINMLRDMNMKIVVEGVESVEMENKLRSLGCDYLQGFLYSKALPEQQFLKLLQEYER